jgi:hypothetical protein
MKQMEKDPQYKSVGKKPSELLELPLSKEKNVRRAHSSNNMNAFAFKRGSPPSKER